MRVSLSWLSHYVDIKDLDPHVIAEALTNSGLEVDEIEATGARFSNVVVGYVTKVEPHPNADRLRLVTVDIGPKGTNQVVCGAPNVRENIMIAYAQIGAQVINRKDGSLFELQPAAIRGVTSTGMICSVDELGLTEQYPPTEEGIWPLGDLVNADDKGRDLKDVLSLEADTVLVAAPAANRGDLMSMIGVAREVAALFKRPFKLPEVTMSAANQPSAVAIDLPDIAVCSYYSGATLTNVAVKPAPAWMTAHLEAAGIRSINVVVDITNYVMLETGHPMHAFDANALSGGKTISVRRAKTDETITTLDDVERKLSEQSVVVCLDDRPIAMAGVMGGQTTQINDATQTVFLEVAHFPAASTRRSARSVGLRSESSARFERGVDPQTCEFAMNRAISLLNELAGATVTSQTQADHRQAITVTVPVSLKRTSDILGIPVTSEMVKDILPPLGFKCHPGESPDVWDIGVPSFRQADVTREIDVIEELIRIIGYDDVPYTLPSPTTSPAITPRQQILSQIRRVLQGCGLSEVMTGSLVGDTLPGQSAFAQPEANTLFVSNSHSIDHQYLRHSVLPSLLRVAKYNQDQGNADGWFYELGRVYWRKGSDSPKSSGVQENLRCAGLMMGYPQHAVWKAPQTLDFYTLKGVVERLMTSLAMPSLKWQADSSQNAYHPGQTALIKSGKTELGFVGQLHPALLDALKLKGPIFVFELDAEALMTVLMKQPTTTTYQPISPFPAVSRDMAFLIDRTVPYQKVVTAINQLNEPLIKDVTLFDEFTGTSIDADKRSLATRLTLQSNDDTLTEAIINNTVDRVKSHLQQQLSVTFR